MKIMSEKSSLKMQLLQQMGNDIEKAKAAYQWLNEDQDVDTPQVSAAIESKPDGIYLVSEDGSVILFGPEWKKPESPVKYIGVKWGSRSLAVALHDQANGEDITLTAKKDVTEYDGYIDTYLDAVANWTGRANTEHLKQIGLNKEISLAENEYIPSLGEMLFVFLNRKAINEALEAVGGTPIDGVWYWTSTESSATYAWRLYLSDGGADDTFSPKASYTFRVRAVSAFIA
jgi:hypothetical protein